MSCHIQSHETPCTRCHSSLHQSACSKMAEISDRGKTETRTRARGLVEGEVNLKTECSKFNEIQRKIRRKIIKSVWQYSLLICLWLNLRLTFHWELIYRRPLRRSIQSMQTCLIVNNQEYHFSSECVSHARPKIPQIHGGRLILGTTVCVLSVYMEIIAASTCER